MTNEGKQKNRLEAEAACENAHLVAQDLVERVKELLFDLPAPGVEEHPINWAHVGSIFADIVEFLAGIKR